jgi:23S rRNA (guanosine2251-2'-O)-methyltransferase
MTRNGIVLSPKPLYMAEAGQVQRCFFASCSRRTVYEIMMGNAWESREVRRGAARGEEGSMKGNRSAKQGRQAGGPRQRRPERIAGHLRIYGTHAVEAALNNPRRQIHAIHATANAAQRIEPLLAQRQVELHTVTPRDLDRMLGEDTVHQGILVKAEPLDELAIADLGDARLLLVLDQVTDPHNVGAMLRSAAVFGVDALIMTARHSPPLQGALAKAASGALEHVPVVLVPNLARALSEIGELGFIRIGLDSGGAIALEDHPASDRLALVLGAEDRGLRRLSAEHCDAICALTTRGPLASLNVSNAAAIALHHAALKMLNRPES